VDILASNIIDQIISKCKVSEYLDELQIYKFGLQIKDWTLIRQRLEEISPKYLRSSSYSLQATWVCLKLGLTNFFQHQFSTNLLCGA